MKKVFSVFATLVSLIMLVGCAKKVSFNEGLKFKKQLTNYEKQAVVAKVVNELDNLVEINTESYQKTYNEIQQLEVKVSSKVTAYSNKLIHTESTVTQTQKNSELTVTDTVKTERDVFDYRTKKMILSYSKSDNGEVDFDFEEYEDVDLVNESFYSDNLLGNVAGQIVQYNAYESGSGYVFVQQNVNKNVQGVQWGNDVKEFTVTQKSQIIVKVDKNYRIIEFTQMNETLRNRDAQTNAWYKKETQTSYLSTTMSFKYGTRKEDTKKAQNVVDILSGTVIENIAFSLKDNDGFVTPLNIQVKHTGINKMHVIAVWTPQGLEEGKEYKYKAMFGYDAKVEFADKAVQSSSIPAERNGVEYEGSFPIVYTQGMTVVFEFDVQVSGSLVTTTYVSYQYYD